MDAAKNILIVDDSRTVRVMFTSILQEEGYRVTAAENGRKAIAILAADNSAIDLIVSDVDMPEMDGISLVKELHRRGVDTPIIMITSIRNISVAVDALKSGASDYILKDEHVRDTLCITVKKNLETRQLIQKNLHLEQLVEQEVRKNREKDLILLQRDKLVSLGKLAAGVAHEINNPMGFIISNLETLRTYATAGLEYLTAQNAFLQSCSTSEERKPLDDLADRLDLPFILEDAPLLIAESLEGADRVKQIVLNLKDFARIDQTGLKPNDLNQCIKNTINVVQNDLKYVADIVLELGELPPVTCYACQINQVMAHLLLNAAQAIRTHGTITVKSFLDGEQVVVTVSDTGIGMSEEVRLRVFEPFYTTRDVGKGAGLGLAVSYDIITKHDGEITVESVAGHGAAFTFRLPVNGPEEVRNNDIIQ